ncbi:WD repeat-containing protein 27 [Thoreauomyces humboldtii]|nr:WD repeat-containing protein 27 [Thoreauomyces humboldtii]
MLSGFSSKGKVKRNDTTYRAAPVCAYRARAPLTPAALALTDDWLAFPVAVPVVQSGGRKARHQHALSVTRLENGLVDLEADTLQLPTAHTNPIVAACFGSRNTPKAIVTASTDSIAIRWLPIGPQLQSLPPSTVLKEDPGDVAHLSMDVLDRYVAACIGDDVHVIEVETLHTVILQGHIAKVTASEFFFPSTTNPNSQNWLLSISEDRTFKVWDVANTCCLYQSAILSASQLTTVAMNTTRFCIGSEDGTLRFHEWAPRRGNQCEPRCLKVLSVPAVTAPLVLAAAAEKASDEPQVTYVNSKNSGRFSAVKDDDASGLNDDLQVEHSPAIVGLSYSTLNPGWRPLDDVSTLSEGENDRHQRLVVGCVDGFALIHPATYELVYHFAYEDAIELAGAYAFSQRGKGLRNCTIMVGNAFSGKITVIDVKERPPELETMSTPSNLNLRAISGQPLSAIVKEATAVNLRGNWGNNVYMDCMTELSKMGIRSVDDLISAAPIDYPTKIPVYVQTTLNIICGQAEPVAATGPTFRIPEDQEYDARSPIRPKPRMAGSATLNRTSSSFATRKPSKPGTLRDQPVTFHSKVKSSGYIASPPARTMFGNPRRASSTVLKPRAAAPVAAVSKDRDALPKPRAAPASVNHGGSITSLDMSPSGLSLATSSADRSVRYHKPLSPEDSTKALIGHNGPVTSVTWSALKTGPYNQLLLTAAMDGSARLWSVLQAEPLLEFRYLDAKPKTTLTPKKVVPPTRRSLHSDILHARFYYKDRFILIPSGSSTHMFTYVLEKSESGSVKPGLNYNSYKLATSFTTSAQNVTAIACMNTSRSHLILTAASDKSLQVWDVAQGKVVQAIEQAQERAIHCIGIYDYETPPAVAAHSFFTAAVTDSIKGWDMRTGKPTMHLHGHVNRSAKVGCSLSPCGRYLLTGSEDNHAYLYDVRKSSIVEKLGGHTDVVSSVGFSPTTRMMATGGHDGRLRLFSY